MVRNDGKLQKFELIGSNGKGNRRNLDVKYIKQKSVITTKHQTV